MSSQTPFDAGAYVDDLINDYAPAETFTVDIDGTRKWTFRSIGDFEQWKEIEQAGAAYVDKVVHGQVADIEAQWMPKRPDNIGQVFLIHALLIEPKLPLWAVAKVAKRLGGMFMPIVREVNTLSSRKRLDAEIQQVEEEKKD